MIATENKYASYIYKFSLSHRFFDKRPFSIYQKRIKPRFYEYIGGTIRGIGGICLEIGGVEDHIHLLVKLKPTLDVPKFLQELKPNVTNWTRRNLYPKFEWQNGYGGFTVGESQIESVRRYIQNQETHHKKVGFEEEFRDLLRKAGIEFDERFLWK